MPRSVAIRARSTSSAGGDLGLLEGLPLGDLQRLELPLALDAAPRRAARSWAMRAVSVSWFGDDLGAALRRPRPWSPPRAFSASAIWRSSSAISSASWRSISSSLCARCALDPRLLERQLERDLLALGHSRAIFISALVERAAAGDLAALRVLLGPDALLGDVALLREPRLLDRLARRPAAPARPPGRAAPVRVASSARCTARRISTSRSCSRRAYSVSRSISSTLRWVSRFWLRMSTSVRCSISLRILRRVSIDLGELGQALGVEGVGRVEIFEAGLVEVDDRHALQLEAVERPATRRPARCTSRGVVAALLVHLLERHLGGDGAHAPPANLPSSSSRMPSGCSVAAAERLRGGGDQLPARRRRGRRTRR